MHTNIIFKAWLGSAKNYQTHYLGYHSISIICINILYNTSIGQRDMPIKYFKGIFRVTHEKSADNLPKTGF